MNERRHQATSWHSGMMPGLKAMRRCGKASGLPEADAEGAPMAATHKNRRGDVFHQHEIAAAHVAPIGLQQKGLSVGGDLLHRPILEQTPVAAMGVVPDRVAP